MSFDKSKLKPCSIGGVPFFIDSAQLGAGREVKVHTFTEANEKKLKIKKGKTIDKVIPSSELPLVEDLGALVNKIDVEAHFIEGARMPDYIATRDAFLKVVNSGGIHKLQLPTFAPIMVKVGRVGIVYDNQIGGMEKVSVVFYRSTDNVQPLTIVDTERKVEDAAEELTENIEETFEETFSITEANGAPDSYKWGLASFVGEDMAAMLGTFADKMESLSAYGSTIISELNEYVETLNQYRNDIEDLMAIPGKLVTRTLNLVSNLSNVFTSPIAAFNAQLELFDSFPGLFSNVFGNTLDKLQLKSNHRVVISTVRNAALAEMALAATEDDDAFSSSEEVIAIRDLIADKGEEIQLLNGSNSDDYLIFNAMDKVISTSITDLTSRIALLPFVQTTVLARSTPLLVVSYGLYSDASRYEEIAERNNVKSNLIPPKSLEVLSE